jgi:hypothetical protein
MLLNEIISLFSNIYYNVHHEVTIMLHIRLSIYSIVSGYNYENYFFNKWCSSIPPKQTIISHLYTPNTKKDHNIWHWKIQAQWAEPLVYNLLSGSKFMTIWSSENDHLYFIMVAILNFQCHMLWSFFVFGV